MHFFFLPLLSIGCVAIGFDFAPVTIIDRCSSGMMMMGARTATGQSVSAELDEDGFDIRNATDGRVLATMSLASPTQLNFRGNLNIGSGVNLILGGPPGEHNFHNALVEFGQGVFGSLGNDGSTIPFNCNRTSCIYNHLFPKAGNGLVLSLC